jgi:hypothetical protein
MPGNQSSSQVASLPGGMYGNLSRPNFIPNTSTTGTRGYTQNEALPLFEITNPQTTYAAFSGRAPHETTTPQTTTTPPQTTTTSNPNSTSTSTIPSTSTSTSTSPITSTSTITSTITSTSTSPSTSTSTSTRPSTSTSTSTPTLTNKSSFANLGANSQVISTEQTVAAKIKKDTKNVERIAIGFITILILIFLIAVITYVKNAKSSS